MLDYQSLLNDEQREVVLNASGPSLVLAGAGSGKTRTLIFKLVRLLEQGASPDSVMLLTFTNKASREMMERAEHLLGTLPKGLAAGTFHSLANRFLRTFAREIGFTPLLNKYGDSDANEQINNHNEHEKKDGERNLVTGFTSSFTILDEGDSEGLITKIIKPHLDLNKKLPKASGVKAVLSFAQNSMQDVENVLLDFFPQWSKFINFFRETQTTYEEAKRSSNAMDFDDLLTNWHKVLELERPRAWFQKQFKHILVDEYQDTNKLQGEIVKILGEKAESIVAVGDDAQSIYSFRAADINNILEFPTLFPGTKVYKLEQNYRSQQHILDVANSVIAQNENQYEKNLKSFRGPTVKPMLVKQFDKGTQAKYIGSTIFKLIDQDLEPHDVAVLVRSSYDTLEIELELAKHGIAYLKRGGIRYFEQAHIKDVLAFLKILTNPKEYIAWIRTLGMLSGIGDKTATSIIEAIIANPRYSMEDHANISNLLELEKHLPSRAVPGFRDFVYLLQSIAGESSITKKINIVVTGFYNDYATTAFQDAKDRIEDIEGLALFAGKYKSLEQFLADVSLSESFKGDSNTDGKVILSTIHQAKGLEWKAVFVPSLTEGKFPHARSSEDDAQLEEERRLFYVAVTRAKDLLYLLHPLTSFSAGMGNSVNKPSRFLKEIPEHLVTKVDPTSSYEESIVELETEPSVLGRVMKMRR